MRDGVWYCCRIIWDCRWWSSSCRAPGYLDVAEILRVAQDDMGGGMTVIGSYSIEGVARSGDCSLAVAVLPYDGSGLEVTQGNVW